MKRYKLLHRKFAVIIYFLFLSMPAFSQYDLPHIKSFEQALQNGTRTNEGVPGEKYWQNRASYNIKAKIIPQEKRLLGNEVISYTNNSPDTLNQIVIHLFQNLYKKGSIRDLAVHPEDVHDGVEIKRLEVRDQLTDDYTINGTLMLVNLKEPVMPSAIISLTIDWEFTIPAKSDIRMGVKDSSSFFLGQWYPKVAVYDDVNGWDTNLHTGGQEFYYDLGDYKYAITVPENYMVWGSGMLKNAREVLAENIYNRYLEAQKTDSVIPIVSSIDLNTESVLTLSNIWEFEAKNVPDIAFGTSDHFLWDGSSLSDISDQNIFVSAAYPEGAQGFEEVVELSKKSIRYFSEELPAYPFPFPAMTIFNGTNGSSGMEYTMIVNDPAAEERGRTVDVTAHEIAHNYFPFFVLTNETEHAWMDEGFASMMPHEYQKKQDPSLNRLTRFAKSMSEYGDTDWNIATMTNSTMLKYRIAYFNYYMKPAVALYVLQDMLGEKLFQECMYTYVDTWKGKHPLPHDFFYLVNEKANKNLNWFWKSWFFGNDYPDLSIDSVNKKKGSYEIKIVKKGDLPVPLDLTITFTDQSKEKIYHSAAIWEKESSKIITLKTDKNIENLELGNDYIPDLNSDDNFWNMDK